MIYNIYMIYIIYYVMHKQIVYTNIIESALRGVCLCMVWKESRIG